MADPMQVKLTATDIAVRLPYTEAGTALRLGGVWVPTWKCWLFPKSPEVAQRLASAFRKLMDAKGADTASLTAYIEETRTPVPRAQDSIIIPDGNCPGLKTQAWPHQRACFAFCHPKAGAMLNMGMGTGKTLTTIALLHDARRVLIITPKAVMAVWPVEFERHASYEMHALPLTYSSVKINAGKAQDFLAEADAKGWEHAAVIVNYESAWREPLSDLLLKQQWDAVVLDECHKIKTPGGRASRFCAKLRKKARKVYGLTGTPMPHSPLDLYGQMRAIAPDLYGSNYHAFERRYALLGEFKQPISYINQQEMQEKFFSAAFQAGRECITLPDATHTVIPVTLEATARRPYNELAKDLATEIAGGQITAANALTKLLRLQQITGGTVKDDDGNMLRVSTAKRAALVDLLDGMGGEPCVVFCRFTSDIDAVREACAQLQLSFAELSGKRNDLAAFQAGEGDVIAVQIQSGGVGVDLTRARYCVYYSLGFDAGAFEQSLARVHRPGQKKPVSYYHLIAKDTVDERVYKTMRDKRDVVASFLKLKKEDFV